MHMQIFPLRSRWNKKTVPVSVGATVEVLEDIITFDFAVRESPKCFCVTKENDGEAVCQDSCVEVFLNMFDKSARYVNFEFNSKGVCFAARGKDRENRVELTADEYALIVRKPSAVIKDGDFLRWTLSVEIPRELLGADSGNLQSFLIEGNICKCADLAEEPHWLTAFPINSPKPDFHRPESFDKLNRPSWDVD